jgi:hypothetical protein
MKAATTDLLPECKNWKRKRKGKRSSMKFLVLMRLSIFSLSKPTSDLLPQALSLNKPQKPAQT